MCKLFFFPAAAGECCSRTALHASLIFQKSLFEQNMLLFRPCLPTGLFFQQPLFSKSCLRIVHRILRKPCPPSLPRACHMSGHLYLILSCVFKCVPRACGLHFRPRAASPVKSKLTIILLSQSFPSATRVVLVADALVVGMPKLMQPRTQVGHSITLHHQTRPTRVIACVCESTVTGSMTI